MKTNVRSNFLFSEYATEKKSVSYPGSTSSSNIIIIMYEGQTKIGFLLIDTNINDYLYNKHLSLIGLILSSLYNKKQETNILFNL